MKDNNVFGAQSGDNTLYVWRSIVKALSCLKEGFTFNMGCGNLSLWFDSWHQDGPICKMVDYVHIFSSHLTLRDFWWNDMWHFDILCISLPENIQESLSRQTLTNFARCEACQTWTGAESGIYSVASAYEQLSSSLHDIEMVQLWSWVWKLVGPKKYCIFIWLIIHEALPTNSFRYKHHLAGSRNCTRCHHVKEDMTHCS